VLELMEAFLSYLCADPPWTVHAVDGVQCRGVRIKQQLGGHKVSPPEVRHRLQQQQQQQQQQKE
jgi:hypothetical protein